MLSWRAFLRNHREVTAALDFFTVPAVTFRLLYCFFVIEHERRRVLHFNVTGHPTAEWVVQQLRETFADAGRYRYVILDRDSKFDADVIAFLVITFPTFTKTGFTTASARTSRIAGRPSRQSGGSNFAPWL